MKTETSPYSSEAFLLRWQQNLARLDARTARGISPSAVRAPDGTYQQANSAEDAYYISIGRGDLASR